MARRLGSPLDSALRLTDADGRQVAFNDDCEDKGAGTARPTMPIPAFSLRCLPTEPTTSVWATRSARAAPNMAIACALEPAAPDFELRIVPSSINIRGGRPCPSTGMPSAAGWLPRRYLPAF